MKNKEKPNEILGNPLCNSGIRARFKGKKKVTSGSDFGTPVRNQSPSHPSFSGRYSDSYFSDYEHQRIKDQMARLRLGPKSVKVWQKKRYSDGENSMNSNKKVKAVCRDARNYASPKIGESSKFKKLKKIRCFKCHRHGLRAFECEKLGGKKKVSSEGKWHQIAQRSGLSESYGPNLNIIYNGYLELMAWKYETEKNKQGLFSEENIKRFEGKATTKEDAQDVKDEIGSSAKVDLNVQDVTKLEVGPTFKSEFDVQVKENEVKKSENQDDKEGELQNVDDELMLQEMKDASFEDDFDLNVLEDVDDLEDFVIITKDGMDAKVDQDGKAFQDGKEAPGEPSMN